MLAAISMTVSLLKLRIGVGDRGERTRRHGGCERSGAVVVADGGPGAGGARCVRAPPAPSTTTTSATSTA